MHVAKQHGCRSSDWPTSAHVGAQSGRAGGLAQGYAEAACVAGQTLELRSCAAQKGA